MLTLTLTRTSPSSLFCPTALSFELEAVGLLIHSSYGFLKGLSITTYGEAVVLGLQVYGDCRDSHSRHAGGSRAGPAGVMHEAAAGTVIPGQQGQSYMWLLQGWGGQS